MKDNTMQDRIRSEAQAVSRITNAHLVCKNCSLRLDDSVRLGNTSICKAYPLKPNEVIKGGPCPKYLKEK